MTEADAPAPGERGRPETEGADEPARYVVRVRGELGPVMLAALPGRLADRVRIETRSVVVTELSDADVVDVVLRLIEHGLDVEIESVRELPPREQ